MTLQSGVMMAVAFLAGLGAATFSGGLSTARASSPIEPQWSYYCFDAARAGDVTERANQAAARGWELIGGGSGSGVGVWCLRRHGPSPLRDNKAP